MQTLNWNHQQLGYEFHCVKGVDGIQLGLHRVFKRSSIGTPVLMLADFMEDAEVFFPKLLESRFDDERGIAPMLAAAGYDVFILDLRGKGRSWPAVKGSANWGLHQAILEDIPHHLSAVARLRPGCPQVWLGKGLGSVLFASTYARLDVLPAKVLGMVHLAAGRRARLSTLRKSLRDMAWRGAQIASGFFFGRVMGAFLGPSQESRQLACEWRHWKVATDWIDPGDRFDYRHGLARKALPPSLYLCPQNNKRSGDLADCRLWLEELGEHDARIVPISRLAGNRHNYSACSLLSHRDAMADHLPDLLAWLDYTSKDKPLFAKKTA